MERCVHRSGLICDNNQMRSKIVYTAVSILLITCCTTAPLASPGIWVTGISESLTRYYIPATTWQEKADRSVTCRLDITYVDEPERPVVCNISFFNKKVVFKEVASLSFMAESMIYPVYGINIMLTRPEYNELRITSLVEINELLDLFQYDKITLKAVIDSSEYIFVPDTEFMQYSKQFYEQVGQDTIS